jgi:hypothetical protein
MDRDKAAVRESIESIEKAMHRSDSALCGFEAHQILITSQLDYLDQFIVILRVDFPHIFTEGQEIVPLYNIYAAVTIWFPRHHTHCVQLLQLHVCSSFKSHHPYLPTRPTKPPLKSMLHALHP